MVGPITLEDAVQLNIYYSCVICGSEQYEDSFIGKQVSDKVNELHRQRKLFQEQLRRKRKAVV